MAGLWKDDLSFCNFFYLPDFYLPEISAASYVDSARLFWIEGTIECPIVSAVKICSRAIFVSAVLFGFVEAAGRKCQLWKPFSMLAIHLLLFKVHYSVEI